MKFKKIASLCFVVSMVAISGCFQGTETTKDNGKGVLIERNNSVVEVKAISNLSGAEFIVDRKINEKDIIVPNNLLKIVQNEGATTKIAVASTKGDIQAGTDIFSIANCTENITVSLAERTENRAPLKRAGTNLLLGDFDKDGAVAIADFIAFANNYGKTYNAKYDISPSVLGTGVWSDIFSQATPDGKVDINDFIIFAKNYSKKEPVVQGNTVIPGEMVFVQAGTTSANNGNITVANDFYIGKYEVTQAEFQSVMGFNPSFFKGDTSSNPVEMVTWYDAVTYCNAKSAADGLGLYYNISDVKKFGSDNNITSAIVTENAGAKGYRLPTILEWEYAARGGKNGVGYTYSGSNTIEDVAWYLDNSNPTSVNNGIDYNGNLKATHMVGGKAANELGIHDMSGNVLEFTNSKEISPVSVSFCYFICGGSFFDEAKYGALSEIYGSVYPHSPLYTTGFRIAVANYASVLTLSNISITTPATKKTYIIGETLDITGLVVKGNYSNGSTRIETVTAGAITGFESTTEGTKTLTITVSGKTTTYEVTVNAVALSSIAIKTPPTKTKYFIGEALDITGLVVEGTYTNGTKKIETITANEITGFNSATAGIKTLVITIGGKTATFIVSINTVMLTNLEIKSSATKTNYYTGDALDLTGLVVEGTYNNGTKKIETITANEISGFDNATAGIKTLVIILGGKTATYQITMLELILLSIEIKTPARKTNYYIGEAIDITGLVVEGTYNNGTKKIETITVGQIDGFDSTTVGGKRLTITIGEKKATYQVIIINGMMVYVEAGTTSANNGSISVSNDFYIWKYEVTQAEFQSLMGFNPSYFKGATSNNPVESVTLYDAVAYCNAKSTAEGLDLYYKISGITKTGNNITAATVTENTGAKGYRLPTEAEWEYAARGGKNGTGYTYSGSNTVGDVAWYVDNSSPTNADNGFYYNGNLNGTHSVGGKSANDLGIYDMSGNVCEWCQDWGNNNSTEYAISRGGSWDFDRNGCEVYYRYKYYQNYLYRTAGFRVCRF